MTGMPSGRLKDWSACVQAFSQSRNLAKSHAEAEYRQAMLVMFASILGNNVKVACRQSEVPTSRIPIGQEPRYFRTRYSFHLRIFY